MHAKKLVKWGVALTSALVLGGVIAPVGGNFANTTSVVHAEEKPITYTIRRFDYENRVLIEEIPYTIYPGETIQIALDDMLGYKLRLGTHSFPVSYDAVLANGVYSDTLLYDKIDIGGEEAEIPTEKPAEVPVEMPVETPTEKPVETPVEQPISVAIIAISEADGPLSHYYVTINPGETKTVEAPKVDGYKLDQYAGPTYELTYDYALGLMNSGGSAWVQFWMIKDTAPETPVDQPVEQPAEVPVETPTEQPTEPPAEKPVETPTEKPAEQPAETKPAETLTAQPTDQPATTPIEQPVEQPANQPTEKPTATSLLAGNTASKAQTGATTDKKKVDNSTPSTDAVKSEEGSQATAKTLPKTGDSNSMFLVLGGLLSGLSGLGLAATSRKRD